MLLANNKSDKAIEIKKHVNAIHSSNNISLVQRKLFNAFLLNAYHDLPKKSQYQISIRSLCALIGYDSHDQKKLKQSILSLITTAVEWSVLDQTNQDESKWRASSIIASARIEHGVCTYEFSSVMRELLYRPEMYGRIDLQVMSKFKSGYGLALYENCVRFQGLSNTPWLSLDVFRKLMGIADENYPVFCDFKKRVLDIALREVNQHSHLQVSPEMQRINKKVTAIRFKLSLKQDPLFHVEHNIAPGNNALRRILSQEFSLSEQLLDTIFTKYEQDYVQEKLALITHSDSFKQGKVRDIAAYLMDALKRDYKKSQSSRALITQAKQATLEKERKTKKIQEEQKNRYSQYVNERIDSYIFALTAQEKQQLYDEFEQNIRCDFYTLKQYKKCGLNHPAVRAVFNMFIKNKELGERWMIVTFEKFVQQQEAISSE